MENETEERSPPQYIPSAASRDYIMRILSPEQRKKEISVNTVEIEEKTKELESLMLKGSVDVLKDLDRLPHVIEGMKTFNKKIDEAEEQILATSLQKSETKKSLQEIKRIKERVKDSISGIKQIKILVETTQNLSRVSNKGMVQIERLTARREEISEEDARTVFLWVCAYKKLSALVRHFSDFSFCQRVQEVLGQSEKRLLIVANVMIQWWICEVVAGIPEIAEQKEAGRKESEIPAEVLAPRKFARRNKEFLHIGKYIYEELDRGEEFAEYVNNARRREMLKLCRTQMEQYNPRDKLPIILRIFSEFLEADAEIKPCLVQSLDPAEEEYDAALVKKLESVISSVPGEYVDDLFVFRRIKHFFVSVQARSETHFRGLSDLLIQTAYKCIESDCVGARQKVKGILQEKAGLRETLFAVASEIRRFFKESRELIHEVEQAENELDDIILKFTNSIVEPVSEAVRNAPLQDAMKVQGFASDLLESIKKELVEHRHSISTGALLLKLPELRKITDHEQAAIKRAENSLQGRIEEISRGFLGKLRNLSEEDAVSIDPDRVSQALEEHKDRVPAGFLQRQLDSVLEAVLEGISALKVYRQMDALENDFAVLYKSVQYLDLESPTAKRILKLFTEIDCLRKRQKKSPSDRIGKDLDDLVERYSA
ncbi:uncharacterized protein NEMAJ01_0760 [Nematocida major]|uniref:uncharacterized protein n=1 Tax=Nematocida major TaxID=1912982 RepID=UPI0020082049|nr:uncharacterized protein NEMAJ01_0760 [Nematocida major]KAH9385864.1 hypothetical protein NEMAJ01_0760 [Nematocida major]